MDATAQRAASPRLVVVADDLTGAVETAALLVAPDGTPPRVLLDPDAASLEAALEAPGALAIDADLRHRSHEGARARLAELLVLLPPDARLLVKVDSLLRGALAAVVEALEGRDPVLCTAVPATGRAVVDGVVRIAGVPLHETDAWRAEPTAPPRSVAEALGGAAGRASLPDAATDADLDAIVAAAPGALVGAAGLARAWAARLAHTAVPAADALEPRRDPLCLIGTASSEAAAQVALAADAGIATLRPDATAIAAASPAEGEPAIVAVPAEPADPAVIEAGFAALARRAAGDRDLVLSGGATARAVLVALDVRELVPIAEVHPGAVVSLAGERRVITRPGSYGAPSSLRAAIARLTSDSQELP